MMRYLVCIAVVVGLLAPSPDVQADGKYFASHSVERDPTIASQRALLAWRDGTQTMIIESVVDGEGQEFGWLLPLPSMPTLIEPCTPGTMSTLAELIQPSISGDRSGEAAVKAAAFGLIIVLLACLVYAATRSGRSAIASALAASVTGLLLVALLLPALAKGRGGAAVAGVEVLSASTVGSYDVAVIAAQTGDDARQWLNNNGFGCDERSARVFDAYVNDGWCFASAKLRHSASGLMSPHPVRIEFTGDTMVYPMRLTGVTDRTLQLDLYIVADGRVSATNLEPWVCDSFELDASYLSYGGAAQCFESWNYGYTIGHPEVIRHFWNGCVLTHLRGKLEPAQMREDIHPTLVATTPIRHRVYSQTAAQGLGVAAGLACVSLVLIAATGIGFSRRDNARRLGMQTALAGFGGAAVVGTAVYAACDVQPISSGPYRMMQSAHAHRLYKECQDWSQEGITRDLELLASHSTTWQPWFERGYIRSGDVPFGFEVRKTERGWTATVYDAAGIPNVIEIPRLASPADPESS